MLGYEVRELTGRNSHSTWHYLKSDGTKYPERECPIYSSLKEGVIHVNENEVFWRKDGSSFPVAYLSAPIMEGDKIKGAVVSFRDISERKKLEERIRQYSKELERSNRDLDNFASIAAHDLRAPLRVV